jgi:hypothetical protein
MELPFYFCQGRGSLPSGALDLYLSWSRSRLINQHPVKQFVPKNVHDKLPVLYMPPSSE